MPLSRPIMPQDVLVGPLAPLGDSLLPPDDPRADRPLDAVLTPAGLEEATGRLARTLASDDVAAVTSYWTLTYFGRLIPAVVAVAIAAPGPVGVTLELSRTAVRLGEDGTLLALRPSAGATPRPAGVALLHHLIQDNLEPMVDAVATWSGLAPRVLWTNAAHYFEWMVKQVLADPAVPAAVADGAEAVLTSPRLADGSLNPLAGRIVYRPSAAGEIRRRKVCCLRYRLPGVADCAALCPSPEVRAPVPTV